MERRRSMGRNAWMIGTLLALGSLSPEVASGQRARTEFPVANGAVGAMALVGDTLFIGGGFTEVSPWLGGGIPIREADATPWPHVPAVEGFVGAAVPDGSGGWFVGGQFQRVGGEPHANLAHVLANGAVAPWRVDVTGPVQALARFGPYLIVGGSFSAVSGLPRTSLA